MSEKIIWNLDKMIENYSFNEELVKKMYDGDYKKLALDLAKDSARQGLELLYRDNVIKKVRNTLETNIKDHNYESASISALEILKENK